MRENAFRFYRGTCHLFYDDLRKWKPIKDNTRVWICGDLHLENFGTYRGENRQIYFDLNDFDEALLAPCTWELMRILVSIHVAGQTLGYNEKDTVKITGVFLENYIRVLKQGKAFMVEKDTARGVVKNLLMKLEHRKRKVFLAQRMVRKKGMYRLRIDHVKTYQVEEKKKNHLLSFFNEQPVNIGKKKFRITDAANRIAGTGSLGIERYVLLAFEESLPHKYHLFDFKEASPSSSAPLFIAQPAWRSEAERVCEIQKRVQGVSPALLLPIQYNKKSFVLKQLQPTQDKVSLELCRKKKKRMQDLVATLGQVTASAHLRAGGRQGSSIADELIFFSFSGSWQKEILPLSLNFSKQLKKDYEVFCKKFDAGYFDTKE